MATKPTLPPSIWAENRPTLPPTTDSQWGQGFEYTSTTSGGKALTETFDYPLFKIDESLRWLRDLFDDDGNLNNGGERIGEPFVVFDHLTGSEPPSNSGTAKYIKLTAGEDGVGGFNEGLLINETTTGSGPTVAITAEIAVGPMAGETVNLVNSENRHIAPGESSGATHNDQMQQITGELTGYGDVGNGSSGYFETDQSNGALSTGNESDTNLSGGVSGYRDRDIFFDSANSPGARTGDKTDVKRIEATAYMRIV